MFSSSSLSIVFQHYLCIFCSKMLSTKAMLLTIAMENEEVSEKEKFVHSHYQKVFYWQLTILECSHCNHWRPRCASHLPKDGPWRRVNDSRTDFDHTYPLFGECLMYYGWHTSASGVF